MEESPPLPVGNKSAESSDPASVALQETTPSQSLSEDKAKSRALWHSPDFMKFWVGQSISKVGDQFGLLATPLLLLQFTHSPLALGLALVAGYTPYLLLGLPAGALIDRLPRRRVMIVCDIIRTLDLVLVAILVMTHLFPDSVTVGSLYVSSAVMSAASIFFDVAYLSALPNLVESEQLLSGNSYLQASDSTARLAAPPLAGAVFQALGAGFALLVDGLSFVASVISLALIPRTFRAASATSAAVQSASSSAAKRSLTREIGEGLRFVWEEPVLRWLMLLLAVFNSTPAYTLGIYRMREQLHFSAATLGLILACAAAGGIVGSFVTRKLSQRFGLVPTILLGVALWSLLSTTFAFSLSPWIFMLTQAISGFALVVIQITVLTLRQAITPDHLMGRVQSVSRLIAWSLIPVGSLVGTALAVPLGASPVIIAAATLGTLTAGGMFLSPLRRMKSNPRKKAELPTC